MKELSEIALRPNIMNGKELFVMMVDQENNSKKPGF
jgi:hypothetical protein